MLSSHGHPSKLLKEDDYVNVDDVYSYLHLKYKDHHLSTPDGAGQLSIGRCAPIFIE